MVNLRDKENVTLTLQRSLTLLNVRQHDKVVRKASLTGNRIIINNVIVLRPLQKENIHM